MNSQSDRSPLWITGNSRTGKTTRLVEEFAVWVRKQLCPTPRKAIAANLSAAVLVFAANNTNRRQLSDRLITAVEGSYPVICKTPVGFITDEVMLFFPLIFEELNLKAQFPLRLRPETEQELATQFWRQQPDWQSLGESVTEYRLVRQTLDLMQLAGASGIPLEDITPILQDGLGGLETNQEPNHLWQRMGELLLLWREWCLNRGLLSYGLIYELYWRYLLPNPQYQTHLQRRYQAVFADDLDDYPGIIRDLLEYFLSWQTFALFTYNPNGQVRLGLNADPDYLQGLRDRCRVITTREETENLGGKFADLAVNLVTETVYLVKAPENIQSLQTISRAELLRQTANAIANGVHHQGIKPSEIAIIAPGLDEIARYSLIEIITAKNIPIAPLNEQRPLISSPLVRSLLTLLGLVYADLGRLVGRDDIAEMLTVFSQKSEQGKLMADIDPVRAGLIADYCYHVAPEHPHLLSVETFPRWDRLGYQAVTAYDQIRNWIEINKAKQRSQSLLTPTTLLAQAIADFFQNGIHFTPDRIAILRELMETAQHFWEVDRRLRQNEPSRQTQASTVAQFIILLRRGTITANPRPLRQFTPPVDGVTLATVFQYRSLRSSHRWQFWLDASSPLWSQGGAATLFAAPLFLKHWTGKTWMPEDQYEMDRQRLARIIRDLLARAEEKIFLCHSDLGVNGTEQAGALLPLVHTTKIMKL